MVYTHSKFTGYYSKVEILEEAGQKIVQKRIILPLSLELVQELEQRIRLQRNALESFGVPIPHLISIEVIKAEEGYNLLIRENFEGLDFADVVDDSNLEFYLDHMLDDVYKPLLKSTVEQNLTAGVDTAVRNFVYRIHSGRFCYVDFMPPKVYYKGHYSQEVPEIDGPFYDIRMLCHYDRAGVIYVQYVNLIRLFPTKRKFIQGKIEQFLDRCELQQLKKYMVNSPFYRLTNAQEAIKTIKELNDWKGINYYYLREGICIASELNSEFRKRQSEMFDLTTHERDVKSKEYGSLPKARFEKVKDETIKALQKI